LSFLKFYDQIDNLDKTIREQLPDELNKKLDLLSAEAKTELQSLYANTIILLKQKFDKEQTKNQQSKHINAINQIAFQH